MLKICYPWPLAFKISVEKFALILMGLYHFIFVTYTLQYSLFVLCPNFFNYDLLFSVLEASYTRIGRFFSIFGELSAIIFLNILSIL
jgi:hypothetical protein